MSTQIQLPASNLVTGKPAPAADMDKIVTALKAMQATVWVYPTGDTSGTEDTANLNAALAALPSGGGTVFLAAGTFYITCGSVVITSKFVHVRGCGRWATFISAVGTGDCLRVYNTDTTGVLTGGGLLDFTIDGTSAGAGSCGLHYGDMRAGELRIAVANFSGAGDTGVHFDNQYAWTEECHGYLWLSNNTQNLVFDVSGNTTSTNSFGYTDLHTEILAKVGQDGVVMQNGALFYNSRLLVKANFAGSATSQSNAVLRITGQVPAGHPNAATYAAIQFCRLDVQAETNATLGSNQPATIAFGTSGSNAIAGCTGVMNFSVGSAFANAVNSANSFQFDGPVFGDSKLFRTQGGTTQFNAGTGLANGGNISTVNELISISPTSNLTGMIMPKWVTAMGSPTRVAVINRSSSFSVAMAVAATSNVSNGTDCVIGPDTSMTFWWDNNLAQWVPAQQPASGRLLCPPAVYAPGTRATPATSSATMAAVDSTNINTGSFVAPASGEVLVTADFVAGIATNTDQGAWALAAHGTITPLVCDEYVFGQPNYPAKFSVPFLVTDLTPGGNYNFDLLFSSPSAVALTVYALGQTSTAPGTTSGGPVTITVRAV